MGLQYTRVGGGSTGGGSYRAMARQIPALVREEMDAAGKAGKGEAQGFIDIAGTGAVWSGSFNGRTGPNAGREDTGAMREAVDYRITGGQDVGLDVGWIHAFEEYFGAQDLGFSAPGFRSNAQTVQGMGMMAHLRFYMRDKVDEAADRVLRRISDGL